MLPDGYHQYHMRFDTEFRDASHLNNEAIADFIKCGQELEALIHRARAAESTAQKLAVLRELKDFSPWDLTHMRYHLLEALSDVDPQAYVNLNPEVKSMSVVHADGTTETYEKEDA